MMAGIIVDFIYDAIYGGIDKRVSGNGNGWLSYFGFYGYESYYGIFFSF